MKVPIDKIVVKERRRKEFGDIDGLAGSIEKHGLLHPLTLTDEFELVAGERRLKACKKLKLKTVECIKKSQLSEVQKAEIELEENLYRKEFTWQEEVQAKWKIDLIKRKLYGSATKGHESGGWRVKDTAMALGLSAGGVSEDIQLAVALLEYPQLAKEPSKYAARKKLLLLRENQAQAELNKRLSKVHPVPNAIHGDCRDVIPTLKEEIHLVIADPPWGIKIEESHGLGKMSGATPFEDDPEKSLALVKVVYKLMYDVLVKDAHAYVFFGMGKCLKYLNGKFTGFSMYLEQYKALTVAGFDVDPLPLFWDKGSASAPGMYTRWTSSYEAIFYCRKGNRDLNIAGKNVLPYKRVPPAQKIHDTEKPVRLIDQLIAASTLPGETVLDPFGGSGVTLEAALQLGRNVIIIEKEKKYYNNICERARGLK